MRKLFLVLCSITLFNNMMSQNPTINKIWIGENLEYLSLKKKNIYFDYCSGITFNNCKLIYRDTSFVIRNYFWRTGKIARQYDDYAYRILKLTNDTLIISPQNDEAARLINNRKTYIFTDESTFYEENLKFQKLFFSKLSDMFFSPIIKLEIDSLGQVYFSSDSVSYVEKSNIYKGLYKGQLNEEQLSNLIEILKRSELDRLPTDMGQAIDVTVYNFKFYYNDKVKEGKGSDVPRLYKPLLEYLLTIYKSIKLEKIDGVYDFNQF